MGVRRGRIRILEPDTNEKHTQGDRRGMPTSLEDDACVGRTAGDVLPNLPRFRHSRQFGVQRPGAGFQFEAGGGPGVAEGEPERVLRRATGTDERAPVRPQGRGRAKETGGDDLRQAEFDGGTVGSQRRHRPGIRRRCGGAVQHTTGGRQAHLRDTIPQQRHFIAAVEGGDHREEGRGQGSGRGARHSHVTPTRDWVARRMRPRPLPLLIIRRLAGCGEGWSSANGCMRRFRGQIWLSNKELVQ
mmetsp:Transcript_136/g.296  ORF Transcript_136/g.296 Transcript_136/m.296 type:complete len:244 (+) Transcript_136:327-1058(+)